MSQAIETAENALRIHAAYPPHVRDREQARYLKELAEHVIRLQAEVNELRAVAAWAERSTESFGLPAPEDYDDDDLSCDSAIW